MVKAEHHIDQASNSWADAADQLELALISLRQLLPAGQLSPNMMARLEDLRRKVVLLQSKANTGKVLWAGMNENDAESFIGYTPSGLEPTL